MAAEGLMEALTGSETGMGSLNGGALLLVIGEPFTSAQKELILEKICKDLRTWDTEDVDLEKELESIIAQAAVTDEGLNGEKVVHYSGDHFRADVLINPQVQTLVNKLRGLLTSCARHHHLVYAGQVLRGPGSWLLQDDLVTFASVMAVFREAEVENVVRQKSGAALTVSVPEGGDWTETHVAKQPVGNLWKVKVNPPEVESMKDSGAVEGFAAFLRPLVEVRTSKDLLPASDVVGNIRFSRPTLYIFPGCQGDSALFGISGFNLLVNGGYSRRACFWDFTCHLDRIDAVLLTHLNADNLLGASSVFDRKARDVVHPEIGYVYFNAPDKPKHAPNGDVHAQNGGSLPGGAGLTLSLVEQGGALVDNVTQVLGHPPKPCVGQVQGQVLQPINLYHKIGHGTLDMYVLTPLQDAKELKEFLAQWNKNVSSFNSGKSAIPLPNACSVCALLVWKPSSPLEKTTRILFPGNAPQQKIMEGLDKLKTVDLFKHPEYNEAALQQKAAPAKRAASGKPAARPAAGRAPAPAPARTAAPPAVACRRPGTPRAEEKRASPVMQIASQPSSKPAKDAKNKKMGSSKKPDAAPSSRGKAPSPAAVNPQPTLTPSNTPTDAPRAQSPGQVAADVADRLEVKAETPDTPPEPQAPAPTPGESPPAAPAVGDLLGLAVDPTPPEAASLPEPVESPTRDQAAALDKEPELEKMEKEVPVQSGPEAPAPADVPNSQDYFPEPLPDPDQLDAAAFEAISANLQAASETETKSPAPEPEAKSLAPEPEAMSPAREPEAKLPEPEVKSVEQEVEEVKSVEPEVKSVEQEVEEVKSVEPEVKSPEPEVKSVELEVEEVKSPEPEVKSVEQEVEEVKSVEQEVKSPEPEVKSPEPEAESPTSEPEVKSPEPEAASPTLEPEAQSPTAAELLPEAEQPTETDPRDVQPEAVAAVAAPVHLMSLEASGLDQRELEDLGIYDEEPPTPVAPERQPQSALEDLGIYDDGGEESPPAVGEDAPPAQQQDLADLGIYEEPEADQHPLPGASPLPESESPQAAATPASTPGATPASTPGAAPALPDLLPDAAPQGSEVGDVDEDSLAEDVAHEGAAPGQQADLMDGAAPADLPLDPSTAFPIVDGPTETRDSHASEFNPFMGMGGQPGAGEAARQADTNPFDIPTPESLPSPGEPGAAPQEPHERNLERDSLEREPAAAAFDPLADWGKPHGLPAPADPKKAPGAGRKVAPAAKAPGKKPAESKAGAAAPGKPAPGAGGVRKDAAPKTARAPASNKSDDSKKSTDSSTGKRSGAATSTRKTAASRPATAPTAAKATGRPGGAAATTKRAATTTAATRVSPSAKPDKPLAPVTPFYVDLTYVPCHGGPQYADMDFFRRVRARYYVISSLSPSPAQLDALLEAKATWDLPDLEVTVIPTYDTETLRHWMALKRETLAQLKVDVSPSASRCTIQLQDHETSCAAYRLEF